MFSERTITEDELVQTGVQTVPSEIPTPSAPFIFEYYPDSPKCSHWFCVVCTIDFAIEKSASDRAVEESKKIVNSLLDMYA